MKINFGQSFAPSGDLREELSKLSDDDLTFLAWKLRWKLTARIKQLPPRKFLEDPANFSVWGLRSGRGFGKAAALTTPIPTPSGFKLLRDIQIGDQVLDEQGKPCRVLATYDVNPEVAYRLSFSDQTSIDCCSDHQWVTYTSLERKRLNRRKESFPQNWASKPPITTQELVETLSHGKRGDRNHCIPVTRPLQLPSRELSIDPWVLGFWLGNGSARHAVIGGHSLDRLFIVSQLKSRGEALGVDRVVHREVGSSLRISLLDFLPRLRKLGVLPDKHVPHPYLWSSEKQREALLAGLMDSDGHIHAKNGHVEFSSTLKCLADAVTFLARSLGQKPVMSEGVATLYGREMGPKYRVTWRPTRNPFFSPRKSQDYKPPGSQRLRNEHRMVVSYKRIKPVPMRCLTVDSPNSMYLCGEALIPTHNTLTAAQYVAQQAYENPGIIGHVVAPTYDDARYICFEGPTGLYNVIPPRFIDWKNCNKALPSITLKNGSYFRGFAADTPDRLRGPQCHLLWAEEIASWRYPKEAWSNMEFGLRLGDAPRIVWTSTPRPTAFMKERNNDPRAIVITGSTYENRANLNKVFYDNVAKYEGTSIGRQELYGEILDPEEAGFVKRSQWRMWPADQPLPAFRFILMSLDTAFTEKTFDKRSQKGDPTACSVWGLFDYQGTQHILLLDCWEDYLGFPQLMNRVKRDREVAYGGEIHEPLLRPYVRGTQKPSPKGRRPDLLLIEDRGSGISLRQSLALEKIVTESYNPGQLDKLSRLHVVSPLFAHQRIWAVESQRNPGEFRDWAEPLISQVCTYVGSGSLEHDDLLDTTTQALRLLQDRFFDPLTFKVDPAEIQKAKLQQRAKRKEARNPYGDNNR